MNGHVVYTLILTIFVRINVRQRLRHHTIEADQLQNTSGIYTIQIGLPSSIVYRIYYAYALVPAVNSKPTPVADRSIYSAL